MRRRIARVWCVVAGACAVGYAQTDAAAAGAADRRQLPDAAHAQPANPDAADDLLRRLIDSSPEDPEAPTWMLDRAEIALRRAARDGAAYSVMFGIPAREQSASVAGHAAAAADLCAQARDAIDAAIARLEERLLAPGADAEHARTVAAQVEPHLARLIEVEQAARLPQLEFAAAALRALSEPANEARERSLRESAARALGATNGTGGGGGVAGVSPRTVLLAAALLLRSDDPGARDAASRLLDRLPQAREGDAPNAHDQLLGPTDAVQLRMALIACGREADADRVPCPGREEDWLVDLLLAEAHARALARAGQRISPSANDSANRAASVLLRVADRYDGGPAALDTPAGPGALRRLVYEKIASVVSPGAPWASMDAEVALARGWSLRASPPSEREPTSGSPSAECLALLEAVASRADAHQAVRAQARWLLAAVHEASPERGRAAAQDDLAWLVSHAPRTRLGRAAAERIVRDHAPDLTGEVAAFESAGQAAAVTSALRLLATDEPPQESTLAALAVALVGRAEVGFEAWAEAAEACERIGSPDQRERVARLLTSRIDTMLRATQPVQERVDALAAAAEWLNRRGEAWRSLELRLRRAELIIESGSGHDIRAEIDRLLGTALDRAGTTERARLRAVRGIAMRRAGDDAGAMTEFRTVASEFERDARSSDADRAPARDAFWCAWAEMLEIACAQGRADAQDRIEQARRHRHRLELLDPALGGEPWAGRIRAATDGNSK